MENDNLKNDKQCAIHDVSCSFSLLMLTARLLTLELELKEANLQMLTYPNEYTDKQIEAITPMIYDLRRAVALLQNGY